MCVCAASLGILSRPEWFIVRLIAHLWLGDVRRGIPLLPRCITALPGFVRMRL
jgi:hypothetical protein